MDLCYKKKHRFSFGFVYAWPAGQTRLQHTRPGTRPDSIMPGQAPGRSGSIIAGQAPGQAGPEKSGLLAALILTFGKDLSLV